MSGFESATAVGGAASTTDSYEYDPIGCRTAKVVDGIRVDYLWQSANVIGEFENGTVVRRYRCDGSSAAQEFVEGGCTYQVQSNYLDTLKSLTDDAGVVV